MDDHVQRDRLHVRPEAALGIEPRAKLGLQQIIDDARRDPAGNEHAAARAEAERSIAGEGAEHGAEHVERRAADRTSPGDRSEEHTSELQSRFGISYAVFCLKK